MRPGIKHIYFASHLRRSAWTFGLMMMMIMNNDTMTAAMHKRQAWSEQTRLFPWSVFRGTTKPPSKTNLHASFWPTFLEIIRKVWKPIFSHFHPTANLNVKNKNAVKDHTVEIIIMEHMNICVYEASGSIVWSFLSVSCHIGSLISVSEMKEGIGMQK